MNKSQIPEEIIVEILEYLNNCKICKRYKISPDVLQCEFCNKFICNKCNENLDSIIKVYFEIYIYLCRSCYNLIKSSSII